MWCGQEAHDDFLAWSKIHYTGIFILQNPVKIKNLKGMPTSRNGSYSQIRYGTCPHLHKTFLAFQVQLRHNAINACFIIIRKICALKGIADRTLEQQGPSHRKPYMPPSLAVGHWDLWYLGRPVEIVSLLCTKNSRCSADFKLLNSAEFNWLGSGNNGKGAGYHQG